MPPPPEAELPETVLFLSVTLPPVLNMCRWKMPPPPPPAVLPAIVLLVIVMLPLLASYFLSFAVAQDADSTLARVLAVVPLSAPLVMPIRIAAGNPSPAAVILAVVLASIAVVLLLRLAGRLYGRTLLRTGARLTWGEAAAAVLGRARR